MSVSVPTAVRPTLSEREIEVLVHWLRTESKASVGRTLYISASTVSTHLQRIRDKYAAVGRPASSKVALAIRAIQDELVDVEQLEPACPTGRSGLGANSPRR